MYIYIYIYIYTYITIDGSTDRSIHSYVSIVTHIYICIAQVIAEHLAADAADAQRYIASQPGMYGRVWYGQGLAFDEAYQILQDDDTSVACHVPPSVHLYMGPIA